MDDHTSRLIHHQQVIVLVDDVKGKVLGHGAQLVPRGANAHPLSRFKFFSSFVNGLRADTDQAGPYLSLDLASTPARYVPRQKDVQANAVLLRNDDVGT